MLASDVTIGEELYFGDEVGGFFGDIAKGFKKVGKTLGKAAKSVVQSPITQSVTGVVAVAFPAVGIPAAAAIATANMAIKKVEAGAAAAKTVNANLTKLKKAASGGNTKAAVAVNAMQVAIAQKKARQLGLPAPRPVAIPGRPSFGTTPAITRNRAIVPAAARQVPTSLYAPTPDPQALARALAAGGSATGKAVLQGVESGQAVAVPDAIAVLPGRAPVHGRRVWVGRAPAGVATHRIDGGHVVTSKERVLSGQPIFVAVA